ncbi:twin-arginine translocation signal domain-containing protein [Bacteroides thetaiotaomicron]|nr:twin-arginine translocation signal domain-containing protein [Bacteroides thetaiotaomicron]
METNNRRDFLKKAALAGAFCFGCPFIICRLTERGEGNSPRRSRLAIWKAN